MSLSPNFPVKDLYLRACRLGNVEVVRFLLSEGADVNWKEDGRLTRVASCEAQRRGRSYDMPPAPQPGGESGLELQGRRWGHSPHVLPEGQQA